MSIITTPSKVHWNYFLALEQDMAVASRYVEFCEENMGTYSVEFAHLLLAAASEADVLAKMLCEVLSSTESRRNIDDYRAVFTMHLPDLASMQVYIPRYGLSLMPWENWANGINPDWWRSYNNVKHERNANFAEANLKNALNALAGLCCLVFHYYHLTRINAGQPSDVRATLAALVPESSLMKFDESFYYVHIVCD